MHKIRRWKSQWARLLCGGLLVWGLFPDPAPAQEADIQWHKLSPKVQSFIYIDYLQAVTETLLLVHTVCPQPGEACESRSFERQIIQKHPVAMALFGDLIQSLYTKSASEFDPQRLERIKAQLGTESFQKLTHALATTPQQTLGITPQEVLKVLGLADCPQTRTAVSPEIVLVTLDEASFEKMGPFPWKRDVYADLITTLNQYGARLIVLDIIFANPSQFPQSDQHLEQTLKQHPNTVIASYLNQDDSSSELMEPLFAHSTTFGLVHFVRDLTGKVQKIPLLQQIPKHPETKALPSIMLQALRKLNPGQAAALEKAYQAQPLCIDFHGGRSYLKVPVYLTRQKPQIFAAAMGKTPEQMFANKIVVVGATAETLHDIFQTPAGSRSGTEILAHYLDTLLHMR